MHVNATIRAALDHARFGLNQSKAVTETLDTSEKAVRQSLWRAYAFFIPLMACSIIGVGAQASESPFGWVYTTDVHPRGTLEFEHKSYLNNGQSQGQYAYLQNKEEIEYGVTDRFQAALYLNWSYANAYRNGIDGTTGGPGVSQFLTGSFDPLSRYDRARFDSVAVELIYQIMNPVTDPLGLALYVEPEFGPLEQELEWRILLQKNFLNDRLILSANINGTIERETELGGDIEKASPVDLLLGASYLVFPNWSFGIEGRIHNEFIGYFFNSPEHSAFFLGPVVHYAKKEFWLTAAWRHQLPIVQTYNADQASVVAGGRIYGEEHARDEIAFRFGIPF